MAAERMMLATSQLANLAGRLASRREKPQADVDPLSLDGLSADVWGGNGKSAMIQNRYDGPCRRNALS